MLLDRVKMEFIGSFLLFYITGMSSINYTIEAISGKSLILINFLTYTLVLWLCKPMSQAHFNPSLTIIHTLTKHTKITNILFYIIAQLLASIFAHSLLKLTISQEIKEKISTDTILGFPISSENLLNMMILETIGTFFLVMCYYLLIEEKNSAKYIYAPALGGVFAGISSFLYTRTGACLNPAKILGILFVTGNWTVKIAIYPVFGPIIGGILGGLVGNLLLSEKVEIAKKRKKKEKNKKRMIMIQNTMERDLLKESEDSEDDDN